MKGWLILGAVCALAWATGAAQWVGRAIQADAAENRQRAAQEAQPHLYSSGDGCDVYRFRAGDGDWAYFTRCDDKVTTHAGEDCHRVGAVRSCKPKKPIDTLEN